MPLKRFFESSSGEILEKLLEEDFSPVQLSENIDIGVSTIRDHLKTLEERGYVEHYFEKAKRGRPKKKYEITPEGRELFPRGYKLVLKKLLKNIEDIEDEKTLRKYLSKVAEDIAKKIEKDPSEKDVETRLNSLVKFFNKLGLYPNLTEKNPQYSLQFLNCGLYEIIGEYQEYLCQMHKEIISNILPKHKIKHKKSYGTDDNTCEFELTPPE